ncbi:MAG: PAS domain S-box protein [Proteobacteria bacterium]|nr:PAS domain S-box protein [Pseudomonadota bacterium]MBU1388234.1 PAS domain S-box protein [Pseudomonadota bacterium]MBU1543046.1 PAS domain S-box protein [Pseudomonadota bacterium]MBU2431644.1 PAS domain S-box protein [Pseudomonadota bacterium]MBU2482981.1 PAS domain S-box protein [Pseudomonadota bacterium]
MKYKLQDLIDIEHFQTLQDRLNKIYSFPSSIIDNEGNILTATAWQDVCTKFHRTNKDCERECIKSDQYIRDHLHEANPAVSYQCPHGLVDNATPIIIDGIHYGNFFTGQFFLDEPDLSFFRSQAQKYGFDEDAYLDAVKRVPIWTQEQLNNYLFFIKGLIAVISESGLKKLKETENRKLIEISEKRHRSILKSAMDGYWLTDTEGRLLEVNNTYCRMSGYSEDELLSMRVPDLEATEDPEIVAEHMQIVVLQGSDRFESKHRRKDGTVFDVEVSIQFRPEKGGQCVCFLRDITEYKKTEKDLKESEERFRYLSDGAMEAIFFTKDGFCLEANQVAAEIFGYDDRSQFIGIFGTDIIAPESHSIVKSHMLTGTFDPYEAVGMRKDGTRFPISIRAKAMPYKDAGIVRVTSITDITNIKQAEKSLRESEEDLKESQRIAHVGSWRLDLASNQVVWSEELYRMYGFDPTSPPPPYTEHQKLFTPESWNKLSTALNNTKDTGIPYELELETLREDGNRGWMWVHGEAVHDAIGSTVGLRGVAQDITERKQTEEALKASEKKYQSLFKNAQVALFRNRLSDGKVLEINERYAKMAGYSNIEDCMAEFNAADAWVDPNGRNELLKILQENGSVSDYETKIIRKDGTSIWISFSATIFPEHGFLEGSIVEITERKKSEIQQKKLQAQLDQAQKMESVGRLAGGVAHDFNNMLSIILGNAEIIMADIDASNPLVTNLEEIYKAAERSANLTRQLLAFARKQTIDPKVLDLNHVLDDMLKMLKRLIGENIDLTWQPAKNLRPVKIDPSQIDQILANLCVNARDAIKSVGKVTIETDNTSFDENYCKEHTGFNPGDYVMMAVSDDGSGMDKKTLDKLFEPFFTTKKIGQGTGLGLATVYGIVKQNNGFINVYSEPGEGTTFKIYLPVHSEPAVSKQKDFKKTSLTGNETILLVEDEEGILRMTKMMLERLGYSVLIASTPNEAISIVEASNINTIHLLMTDVVMPEMNGRDLSKILLSMHPGLKCLFMSGYTANVIAHHGVLDTGVQFINKPFSSQDLATKVREVLDEAKG